MAKSRKLPWLGALVATPAMTASVQPAAATPTPPTAAASDASAPAQAEALRAALKAELLSISPADMLTIAGDRMGPDPLLEPLPLAVGLAKGAGAVRLALTNGPTAPTASAVVVCASNGCKVQRPIAVARVVHHQRTGAKAGICVQATAPNHHALTQITR